jgi:hypothetical protein
MNLVPHWLTRGFDGIVGFLPNLIGGLVILFIGWVAAALLRRVTRPLLHRVGFDRLMQRLGLGDPYDAEAGSSMAASVVYVVAIVATLMQVARTWRLEFVAAGLAEFLGYLPHAFGAVVIFGAALFFGNWVRDRILHSTTTGTATTTGATPAMGTPPSGAVRGDQRIVASAVRGGILALGAFMALRELQIGSEIVTIGFALVLGAIALAAALAFGLGSRDVAASFTRQWYDKRARGNGTNQGYIPRDEERWPEERERRY